jgi:hypothetical protein
MTAGMNRDGFPRQHPIHLIGDDIRRTEHRGPRRSVRPLLYLLPYPRRRHQGPRASSTPSHLAGTGEWIAAACQLNQTMNCPAPNCAS